MKHHYIHQSHCNVPAMSHVVMMSHVVAVGIANQRGWHKSIDLESI